MVYIKKWTEFETVRSPISVSFRTDLTQRCRLLLTFMQKHPQKYVSFPDNQISKYLLELMDIPRPGIASSLYPKPDNSSSSSQMTLLYVLLHESPPGDPIRRSPPSCLSSASSMFQAEGLSDQCIMYKTFSSIILNRFETLNLRLLSQIANIRPQAREGVRARSQAVDEEEAINGARALDRGGTSIREGTPVPPGKGGLGGGTPGGTPGTGKKKKKGKR